MASAVLERPRRPRLQHVTPPVRHSLWGGRGWAPPMYDSTCCTIRYEEEQPRLELLDPWDVISWYTRAYNERSLLLQQRGLIADRMQRIDRRKQAHPVTCPRVGRSVLLNVDSATTGCHFVGILSWLRRICCLRCMRMYLYPSVLDFKKKHTRAFTVHPVGCSSAPCAWRSSSDRTHQIHMHTYANVI